MLLDNYLIDIFAESLCNDFEIPLNLFKPVIVKQIKDQINEYATYCSGEPPKDLQFIRIIIKVCCCCF